MTQPYAAGAILSTVGDLWKWHQAVHSYKLVNKQTLDKAFTAYKLKDGKSTGYGYGWEVSQNIQDSPTIEHGGAINGFLSEGIYLPDQDVFVVVLSNNITQGAYLPASNLAAFTIGKPYAHAPIAVSTDALQQYVGVYENVEGALRAITLADNKLYLQRAGGYPRVQMIPYQKDQFVSVGGGLNDLKFVRTSTGQVGKARYANRQGAEEWQRSSKPMSITVADAVLQTYVGDYELAPNFILTITKDQNQLISQATGQNKFPMLAESETKFYPEAFPAQINFIKDDTGKVTKLVLVQNGNTIEAKKLK